MRTAPNPRPLDHQPPGRCTRDTGSDASLASVTPDALVGRWVPAAPFRLHFRHVVAQTGLPWGLVAMAAGLPQPTALRLVHPHRANDKVREVDAARIIALSAGGVTQLLASPTPAEGATTMVRWLLRAGWTVQTIATHSGVPTVELRRIADGCPECSRGSLLRLRLLRERLQAGPALDRARVSVGPGDDRREAA